MAGRVSGKEAAATVLGGLLLTGAACYGSIRGVEPVATWLYPFAWYPLLLALEGAVALRRGRFLLLDRPRLLLSVLGWSAPVWMLWELLNFRLHDWYYVFVPDRRAALWVGVVASFATVLPVCFLPAAAVGWGRSRGEAGGGGGEGPEDHRTLSPRTLRILRLAGLIFLLLPLARPRLFFPLVWGCFPLLLEPDLYRRTPSRSLLADVVEGRWRRVLALLAGGALAGLIWEAVNEIARGGWIYTVPGFEGWKLFEMPLPGFLGFPPLALSCFSIYQWLALRGWAEPLRLASDPVSVEGAVPSGTEEEGVGPVRGEPEGRPGAPGSGSLPGHVTGPGRVATPGRAAVRVGAAILVVVTLLGMERWTISSRTPRLRDLPGLLPSQVEALRAWGVESPFDLAATTGPSLARRVPGVDAKRADGWIDVARLAVLRGMGTRNARFLYGWGIRSVSELARVRPDVLETRFRELPHNEVRPAQVRVWWRAARERTTAPGSRSPGSAAP